MAVAEKYRVVRDFKFNGRDFQRGDAIERAYIVAVAPEKEGTLLRTRFIELAPHQRDLSKMTKSDLVELGRTVGATVDPNWRKADLIEAIEGEL
jgi:hypothetical protein